MKLLRSLLVALATCGFWPLLALGQSSDRNLFDYPSDPPAQPATETTPGSRADIRAAANAASAAPSADAVPKLEAPYIGLEADDRQSPGRGITVTAIVPGGPAERAGLMVGDLITSLAGQPIQQLGDMLRVLTVQAPGRQVEIEASRQGVSRKYQVMLGSRPAVAPSAPTAATPAAAAPTLATPADSGPRLGVHAEALTKGAQVQFGLAELAGVWVSSITPGSPANLAQLPPGIIITALDSKPIKNPDELGAAIQRAGPGAEVELTYLTAANQESRKKIVLGGQPSAGGMTRTISSTNSSSASAPSSFDSRSSDGGDRDSAQRVDAMERRIRELEARIEELETSLRRASSDSYRSRSPDN